MDYNKENDTKIPLFFAERTRINSKLFFTIYGIILLISLVASSYLFIISFSKKSGSLFVSNIKKS
jgi:hypothetical protein